MKLADLLSACGLEAVVLPDEEVEIRAAYTSDLLSDVMAHCPENSILVTAQNHANTIAIATLVGACAIAVVHSRPIPDDMKAVAQREGVALLRSADDQFSLSCRLGELLRKG